MPTPSFALVHSPLVGPSTWERVAGALERHGARTTVPALTEPGQGEPFWQGHARAAAAALAADPDQPVVLAGHSGAGPLLPAIRAAAGRAVAAYLFVDAGLPADGQTRLGALAVEDPDLAAEFERHLGTGGRFPEWSDQDLADEIPDPTWRRRVLAELRPRARPFWVEPLPVPAGWPDAPCAYLRLSSGYLVPARQAVELGWPLRELDAGHFHLLADPDGVAAAMLDLVEECAAASSR
ncbi:MAG TPA: alpha/beta hydrolase [Actinomycetota bacterium]|nr:alpha/beta hydrolase [Actinomycetota bacterium]